MAHSGKGEMDLQEIPQALRGVVEGGDSMSIGERIKALRYERNWTQRILSDLTGFTEKAIADWEKGRYVPSERGIRALEKAFGEQLRK